MLKPHTYPGTSASPGAAQAAPDRAAQAGDSGKALARWCDGRAALHQAQGMAPTLLIPA